MSQTQSRSQLQTQTKTHRFPAFVMLTFYYYKSLNALIFKQVRKLRGVNYCGSTAGPVVCLQCIIMVVLSSCHMMKVSLWLYILYLLVCKVVRGAIIIVVVAVVLLSQQYYTSSSSINSNLFSSIQCSTIVQQFCSSVGRSSKSPT